MHQEWVTPVPTSTSKLSGLCDGTVRSYANATMGAAALG